MVKKKSQSYVDVDDKVGVQWSAVEIGGLAYSMSMSHTAKQEVQKIHSFSGGADTFSVQFFTAR